MGNIKLKSLIQEKFFNTFDTSEKLKYIDKIAPAMLTSYAKMGGYKKANTLPEVVEVLKSEATKEGIWKIVIRNGKVTAFTLYKDLFGRKSFASGTDGTPRGKSDWLMIRDEDNKFGRAWGEVSGPVEKILLKRGYKMIPVEKAQELLGAYLEPDDDGYHYTRLIGGKPYRKVVVGHVKSS